MRNKLFTGIVILFAAVLLISCQKEIDGTLLPGFVQVDQKPKLGTKWIYQYSSYYSYGSLRETYKITYTASSEEVLGGDKWLNITDSTGVTFLYLNEKTGSLYQYTNNNSYLFCKYPGVLNEMYSSYNNGSAEDFYIRGIKDSIIIGPGTIAVNYYEGVIGGKIFDKIWYNDKVWIAQKYGYKKLPLGNTPYRYSTLVLQFIIY